jgi:hypothetical protein
MPSSRRCWDSTSPWMPEVMPRSAPTRSLSAAIPLSFSDSSASRSTCELSCSGGSSAGWGGTAAGRRDASWRRRRRRCALCSPAGRLVDRIVAAACPCRVQSRVAAGQGRTRAAGWDWNGAWRGPLTLWCPPTSCHGSGAAVDKPCGGLGATRRRPQHVLSSKHGTACGGGCGTRIARSLCTCTLPRSVQH